MIQGQIPKYYEFHVTELREKSVLLGSVYFVRDITLRKKMIREPDHLASYDSLTHVYNRSRFMEEATRAAERVQRQTGPLCMLMIDIDFFKQVNDEYGHLAGDEVIRSIVMVCKERVRGTDIIGRYGGEEFVILLPAVDVEYALNVAEQIRRQIEDREVVYDRHLIKITVSIGVAMAANDTDKPFDVYQLLNQSDMALYYAKNNGRNHVCLDPVSN